MNEAGAGYAARQDSAILGLELPEQLGVKEVNVFDPVLAEAANLGFTIFPRSSTGSSWSHRHNKNSLLYY
jgi:hypothetical protein